MLLLADCDGSDVLSNKSESRKVQDEKIRHWISSAILNASNRNWKKRENIFCHRNESASNARYYFIVRALNCDAITRNKQKGFLASRNASCSK